MTPADQEYLTAAGARTHELNPAIPSQVDKWSAYCSPLATRPLSSPEAERLATLLKALAHPIRLRLLSLVANHPDGEACVCTIAEEFRVSGPTISHHLRLLREASVVECQRRGSWVYYRAVPHTLNTLAEIIAPRALVRPQLTATRC